MNEVQQAVKNVEQKVEPEVQRVQQNLELS